ncbi:tyrosine-type recombinase/integrase [Kineococcus sp. R8]|uniref:tyrosine-type recombinase/integrase n=1 Tax=Kineococcus siccus TaxID=2696567 RepID=UPI00141331BE|nr:site-specific integrase [Kineococcus siccus]NAZ80588.1 tyrosine-type recombinase/integrase [Kineococcus siccus]
MGAVSDRWYASQRGDGQRRKSVRHGTGKRWLARYQEPSGAWRSGAFEKKSDAEKWLREREASIVTGQYVDPAAGRLTFHDYAEQWRTAQVHRPTTQAHTETSLRRHAYPFLGDRALGAILPSDVQAWVKRIATGDPVTGRAPLSPSTVGVVHGIVSGIFRAAVRDRRVVANPCTGTRLPKVTSSQVIPPTTEEVRRLEEAIAPRWRALVTLAAGTGMRHGECLGLTVDRVDFLRRRLVVDRQLVTVPGRDPFLAPPKTAASVRTIPLPRVVVDALAAHLRDFPAASGFVFTDAHGQPMRRTAFSARVWRPAIKSADLPTTLTFHHLRHYYASLLIRHSESVKTVQARLGHANAAETLDTYSHLWPDSEDRTRDAVDAVLGGGGLDQDWTGAVH